MAMVSERSRLLCECPAAPFTAKIKPQNGRANELLGGGGRKRLSEVTHPAAWPRGCRLSPAAAAGRSPCRPSTAPAICWPSTWRACRPRGSDATPAAAAGPASRWLARVCARCRCTCAGSARRGSVTERARDRLNAALGEKPPASLPTFHPDYWIN